MRINQIIVVVLAMTCSIAIAQTRIKGGAPDQEGDLTFSQVLPRAQKFWEVIGRGHLPPDAIKWRKEKSYRNRDFIIWAGGATLLLDVTTGNISWFTDFRRTKEQRAGLRDNAAVKFHSAQEKQGKMLGLAKGLGFFDAAIVELKDIGGAASNSENRARRIFCLMESEAGGLKFNVVLDATDGSVSELFALGAYNGAFRTCVP